ncbi:(4Fe-4S)-binding protein [Aquiflexum sp.]|uniref:(4Fe-4S)-binding protein n=1 Tax=Aquiflexum sp. TaxID=1872584 RepID=UPI0035944AAC
MEKKGYSNGEITVTWEPKRCTHSGNCVRGLPKVFKPKEKPWISINAASTIELIEQVKKCPSGALGYYLEKE